MIFYTNHSQFNNPSPENPFEQIGGESRLKRFLKAQPVLALLIAQSIVLYILAHAGFMYSLKMVLMLYFGGLFLRQHHNDIYLVVVYLAGAFTGFLLYPLMFGGSLLQIEPLHAAAIQGSAIMALMAFPAVSQPGLKLRIFFFSYVRFSYIMIALMVMILLSNDLEGGGTHLVYPVGAIVAAAIAFLTVRKESSAILGYLRQIVNFRQSKKFTKYETINEAGNRPMQDVDYNDIKADRQKKIDEILEKISASGYDSLTKAEKELLFRQSE